MLLCKLQALASVWCRWLSRSLHCPMPLQCTSKRTMLSAVLAAYNARYPTPQNPDVIATQPNHANTYLNTSFPQQFVNSASVQPNNSYYSVDLPGAHLITLSNYVSSSLCCTAHPALHWI